MRQTLYIVTGMHRSGTSAVVKMLEVCGISLPGELLPAGPDNPKGFFEDVAILKLNDELLGKLELEWDSLNGFFLERKDFSHPKFNMLKKRARDLLQDRSKLGTDWAFKDPRLCRLMNFWLPIIEDLKLEYKVILAFRPPDEVAGSLASRDDFHHLKSLYLWFFYNLSALQVKNISALILVNFQELIKSPHQTIETLSKILPPAIDEKKRKFISSFLTNDLYHHEDLRLSSSLDLAEKLYSRMEAGKCDYEFVNDLRQQVAERQGLAELMTLFSKREKTLEKQKENDQKKHAKTIIRKESDIQGLKAFQQKLNNQIRDEKKWSRKLSLDINKLSSDLESVQSESNKYRAESNKYRAESKKLQQLNQETKTAAEQESKRLWEIIEVYRKDVEAMKNSHSWRVTAPARWVAQVTRQTLAKLVFISKRVAIRALHKLPVNSGLRQFISIGVERLWTMVHGYIGMHSGRKSHQNIINNRKDLLGEKPLLNNEKLIALDISIVTFNSSKWVEQFHKSICLQDYPLSLLNLIFVDNGSTDDTIVKLNNLDWSRFAGVTILGNENVGFGAGHNLGIKSGEAELVLVTNIDLEFAVDSLRQVVSFAKADEHCVASWELRQLPFEHPKFYDPVTLQTAWSSHACILMRRKLFEFCGGYESKIFMYGEDVELSYRYRALGYKLRYIPKAKVYHYSYEKAGEVKPLQYQGSTLANAYLRFRYGSMTDICAIFPMYSQLLFGLRGITEHRRLIWRNLGKVFANAPYFLSRRLYTGYLSFLSWDYEKARAGAFFESKSLPEEQPLVTVITRTYRGREKLLNQCMQSVANQTYRNIEHVIVEDGGSSQSHTIKKFKQFYPSTNLVYLSLEKLGRCHAGNKGMSAAKGKYLVFLDDDDLFFADHLEVCVAELEANSSLAAVYALAWEVETQFDGESYEERSHRTPPVLAQEFDLETLHHHNYIPIQAIVFKSSLFEEHGGFDPDLENLEDWNLWVKYASTSEFKMIAKTTSMHRTPWDIEEKSRRQITLDAYLKTAREKNKTYRP